MAARAKAVLRDISRNELLDAWRELNREVTFRAGQFEGPADPALREQRERVLVLGLLVAAAVAPGIWRGEQALPPGTIPDRPFLAPVNRRPGSPSIVWRRATKKARNPSRQSRGGMWSRCQR